MIDKFHETNGVFRLKYEFGRGNLC